MFVNQNPDTYDRKTDTYIVAYIDLLGMTNRIKGTDRQLVMNKFEYITTQETVKNGMFQSVGNSHYAKNVFTEL